MNEASEIYLGWLLYRDFCVYCRPWSPDGVILWRVTAERPTGQLIYVVAEDEDLDVAIKDATKQVRKKLGLEGLKKKRRRRGNNTSATHTGTKPRP